MNHFTTPRFWAAYEKLPDHVQQIADRNFVFLKSNPRHPSLHFKKAGNFWSVRVGREYRALGIEREGDIYWVWIGTHAEYNRLIQQ